MPLPLAVATAFNDDVQATLMGPDPDGICERATRALTLCVDVLSTVDSFDLSCFESAELDRPVSALRKETQTELLEVWRAVTKSKNALAPMFSTRTAPLPVEEPCGEPKRRRDNQALRLDRYVQSATAKEIGDTIAAMLGMFHQELDHFLARTKNPVLLGDRWLLLEELQEFKARCTKFFEAVAAVVLHGLGHADLTRSFPRYVFEGQRAASLRVAIANLEFDVAQLCTGLAALRGEALARRFEDIHARVLALTATPPYRDLRASDKKAVIVFLQSYPRASNTRAKLDLIEDFGKFLELMRNINARQELKEYDRVALESALALLQDEGTAELAPSHLEQAYGRDRMIDDWLRDYWRGMGPEPESALPQVERVLAELQMM